MSNSVRQNAGCGTCLRVPATSDFCFLPPANVQRNYEAEMKAKLLAAAVKAQDHERETYEEELKKSEEGNRNLVLQFTLVQVGGLYAVR